MNKARTKDNKEQKGFTLIELLIVVAIIAILAVVVILTLNPAELLKQGRDSTRISDLASLKSAISLYLASVTTNVSIGSAGTCYAHVSSTISDVKCGGRYQTTTASSTSALRVVSGTGWIPINFNQIPSGSPISVEPIDPINNATYFYSYAADATNLTFQLDAKMESVRYSKGGSNDVESTDGGASSTIYETGSAPGLAL